MSRATGARTPVRSGETRAVRVRLTSTQDECMRAVEALGQVFEVARVSEWLPMRRDSTEGRIYAYVRPLPIARTEVQR